jgi:serine/threonine protein kinase
LSQQEAAKLTKQGGWIGTPGYMSPEQQAGEASIDLRTDLYSLGVTLYEALSGKAIPQGQYQELALMNQAIPPQIDDLVLACLQPRDARVETAKTFVTRLASALLSVRPLQDVLSHGRLHEIALALRELTPDTFGRLPAGQRQLVLVKLEDVVGSDDPKLEYAAIQLLELLLTRGLLLDKESYRQIVGPAISRGFDAAYESRISRRSLRDALEKASAEAQPESHSVIEEEFVKFMEGAILGDTPDFVLHEMREVIQALMSNPACTTGAKKLAECLRRVNRAQTERT